MKIGLQMGTWGRMAVVSLLTGGLLLSGSGISWGDRDGRQGRPDERHEMRHEGDGRHGGRNDRRPEGGRDHRAGNRDERRHDGRNDRDGDRNRRGQEDHRGGWERGHFEKERHDHRRVTVIRELPRGHRTVVINKTRYYVHDHRYYTHDRHGYVLVTPPVGAVFATLPFGSVRVTIGTNIFFRHGDLYYRQAPRGYVLVAPPVPSLVSLPTYRVLVQISALNVRSGPGMEFPVVAEAWRGETLTVVGHASGWQYVELPDGTMGWIMDGYTRPLAAG